MNSSKNKLNSKKKILWANAKRNLSLLTQPFPQLVHMKRVVEL